MKKQLEEKIKEFEHNYHPMHLYNDLVELKMAKKKAIRWMEIYEIGVYKNILEDLKHGME